MSKMINQEVTAYTGIGIAGVPEDQTFSRYRFMRASRDLKRWKFTLFDQSCVVAARMMNIPCRYICGGYKGRTIHHFNRMNQFTGYVIFEFPHSEAYVKEVFLKQCDANAYVESPGGYTKYLIRELFEDCQRFYARGYLKRKEIFAYTTDEVEDLGDVVPVSPIVLSEDDE